MTRMQNRKIKEYINTRIKLLDLMESYGFSPKKDVDDRHKMHCPLHSEKTASFFIYPNNSYYCFGCASGGKTVNFIMEYEKKSFKEVLSMFSDDIDVTSDKFIVDTIVKDIDKDKFDIEKYKRDSEYHLGIFLRKLMTKKKRERRYVMECFREMDGFFSNDAITDKKFINEFVDSIVIKTTERM